MSDEAVDALEKPKSAVEKIEDAIVAHLKSALPATARVDSFPDDPENFDQASLNNAVLVQYVGSRYAAADGLSADQPRTPSFAVHLYLRSLRGPDGSYGAVDLVRKALQGARTQGPTMSVTRDHLAEVGDGLWHWIVEVQVAIRAVAPNRLTPTPFIAGFQQNEDA